MSINLSSPIHDVAGLFLRPNDRQEIPADHPARDWETEILRVAQSYPADDEIVRFYPGKGDDVIAHAVTVDYGLSEYCEPDFYNSSLALIRDEIIVCHNIPLLRTIRFCDDFIAAYCIYSIKKLSYETLEVLSDVPHYMPAWSVPGAFFYN